MMFTTVNILRQICTTVCPINRYLNVIVHPHTCVQFRDSCMVVCPFVNRIPISTFVSDIQSEHGIPLLFVPLPDDGVYVASAHHRLAQRVQAVPHMPFVSWVDYRHLGEIVRCGIEGLADTVLIVLEFSIQISMIRPTYGEIRTKQ